MDNSRWFRFMAIGLVLAAVAAGYFLLTGRIGSKSITKTQASPSPFVLGQNTKTPSESESVPSVVASPTPTPVSAYSRIASRTQNNAQALPATGFPVGLAITFSASALIAGWGLRRFPK